jgi:hypothetical protein
MGECLGGYGVMGVYGGPTESWIDLSPQNSLNGLVTNGLVLALDAGRTLSYPGSGTTWSDLSGLGNNGTLVNGVGYSGDNLGSLSFDGVDDRVNFSYNSSYNIGGLNLTISSWIRSTALANSLHGAGILVRESGANDGLYELLLLQTNSKNYSFFRMNGIGSYSPNIFPIELNQIYNIVCVYDNGTMRIYVNGIEEGSGNIRNINITTNATRTITLGRRFTTSDATFSGNIYQTSIYNRALTASEIQQNFIATRSRFGI